MIESAAVRRCHTGWERGRCRPAAPRRVRPAVSSLRLSARAGHTASRASWAWGSLPGR